jgi:hypothetical protein
LTPIYDTNHLCRLEFVKKVIYLRQGADGVNQKSK